MEDLKENLLSFVIVDVGKFRQKFEGQTRLNSQGTEENLLSSACSKTVK